MDESGRRRSSKWDLIDGQRNPDDNGREKVRPGNYRSSSNEYRSYPGRHASGRAAESDAKFANDVKDIVRSKYDSSVPVRENESGSRGSWRDNSLDRGNRGFSNATTNWEEDGNRRDHGQSPRGTWKRPLRSRSRSRSRSRGRSRSRSPLRAYRHDPGMNDRSKSRPEVPVQTCRDFTSGRCRRGSHCPFLHPSDQSYEDRRYDYDHRLESTRSGKYSHHSASDGYYNDYTRDAIEPRREHDRSSRGLSFNPGAETRRSSDIPCTFFAAGNCRNGNFCPFSHHIPSSTTSGGRTHDVRGRTNHSPGKADQMDRGRRYNEIVDHRTPEHGKEGRWRTNHSPNKVDQMDQSVKITETIDPRVAEFGKESHDRTVPPQPRHASCSVDDRWDNNLDANHASHGGPTTMDRAVDVQANQSSHWKTDNTGNMTSKSDLKGVDNWIGDKMSPEWNPKVSSARSIPKEEPVYPIQTSESVVHNVSQQSMEPSQHVSSVIPNVVEKPNFQQSFNSVNDATGTFSYVGNVGGNNSTNITFMSDTNGQPSTQNIVPGPLNGEGQGQFSYTPNHLGNANISDARGSAANYDIYSINSNSGAPVTSEATCGAQPTAEKINQDHLVPMTDLSASLAHLLGKRQQLPQFYAAMTPPNSVVSVAISTGLVSQFPAETVQPYPPTVSEKPCDPVGYHAEQSKPTTVTTPTLYPPVPIALGTVENGKYENAGESHKNGVLDGNLSHKQPNLNVNSKHNIKAETIAEESSKRKDKHANSREGSPMENMDGEGKVDGGKKVKDTKVVRDFKHALVNLVKELLKPAWKDGQIDKDGFKTIVKKVADKVTATIQEASIPQTPEKVEQYLSAAKPKLTKLVQAYVDRSQKKQT